MFFVLLTACVGAFAFGQTEADVDAVVQKAIDANLIPGAGVAVVRVGESADEQSMSFGEADRLERMVEQDREMLREVEEMSDRLEALQRAMEAAGLQDPELQRQLDELRDDFALARGVQTEARDVYALGDAAAVVTKDTPQGHPQVAPVAIQQGRLVAENLKRQQRGKPATPFRYRDRGSMATIGRMAFGSAWRKTTRARDSPLARAVRT